MKRNLICDTGYDWQDKTVTVNYKEKGTSDDHIFGKGSKTWDKIKRGSDFVETLAEAKIKMSDEMKNDLWQKEWVIAFWDTNYENTAGGVLGWLNYVGAVFGGTIYKSTVVKDATVIRLEFLKDGKVYNLGAVSNKSGDFDVIGGGDETFIDSVNKVFKDFFSKLPWWAWLLIFILCGSVIITVLSIIFPVVRTALKAIFFAIGKVFKGIWWVICLPFKAVAALVKRNKGKKK